MNKCFAAGCDDEPEWEGEYNGQSVLICHNDRWRVPRDNRRPLHPDNFLPLNFLVCDECGESFDEIMTATAHEFQQHSEQTLDGDHVTYKILAESEAL